MCCLWEVCESGRDDSFFFVQVCQIVQSCPSGCLVLVVGGSSYLKEVRRLQNSECSDSAELKEKVMDARRGFMVSFLKQ